MRRRPSAVKRTIAEKKNSKTPFSLSNRNRKDILSLKSYSRFWSTLMSDRNTPGYAINPPHVIPRPFSPNAPVRKYHLGPCYAPLTSSISPFQRGLSAGFQSIERISGNPVLFVALWLRFLVLQPGRTSVLDTLHALRRCSRCSIGLVRWRSSVHGRQKGLGRCSVGLSLG